MNLLPKSHKEFSEKDYWNKFFKKRGNKAFEWYGEYLELCSHLHKYMKQTDKILITGCGNSSLSADLYDVGFTNIINIDVSEVAIKQMKNINAQRTKMKFLCMDALNTNFQNDEFNVVLDKGTLDALMPDDSKETNETIDKYFGEIKRVLKLGGRFVCISLLQSHILSKLLATFCDKSWMFRVVRCHEAEEKNAENGDGTTLPVFVVIATKFKEMPQLIAEVCLAGDKMLRLKTAEELRECIKSAQETAFVTNGLAKTSLDEDEVTLDLMQPGSAAPRYTLHVVDQKLEQAVNKYAVFIVPQGRESEWLFGTPQGRRQLQDSARFGRLVVAVLRRGHAFSSLDAVKEELAHSAKMLLPYGFSGQIPFLSLGSDLGSRETVHSGTSEVSGDFVVEDVDVEGVAHRRLVFMDNQFLVQSEARLKQIKKKNKTKLVIDFGHISPYHTFMCVGAYLSPSKMAVLGLGGGGLCMFLRKCLDTSVTAVDLDPAMLEIAKDHFELKLDDGMKVEIKDGVDFLKDEAEKGSQYSVVMFDMDSKDRSVGLSCPPRQFLQAEQLACVNKILTNDGHFILNLVCRDNQLHDATMHTLKQHFKHLVAVKLYEEVNEIVFGTNGAPYTVEGLEAAAKGLNGAARQKGLNRIKCVDLKDFLQSIEITPAAEVEVPGEQLLLPRWKCLESPESPPSDFYRGRKRGSQYSVVMFDMDSKDRSVGLSCPPRQFLQAEQLACVNKILTNDGHFILNLVCRDNQLHDATMHTLKQHFKHLVAVKLYEEVNEIVFGTNGAPYTVEGLEAAAKGLNGAARQKGLNRIKCVDLKDFLQSWMKNLIGKYQ